jgi:hypothetical protein
MQKDILEEVYPCKIDPIKIIHCAEWMEEDWMEAIAPT